MGFKSIHFEAGYGKEILFIGQIYPRIKNEEFKSRNQYTVNHSVAKLRENSVGNIIEGYVYASSAYTYIYKTADIYILLHV